MKTTPFLTLLLLTGAPLRFTHAAPSTQPARPAPALTLAGIPLGATLAQLVAVQGKPTAVVAARTKSAMTTTAGTQAPPKGTAALGRLPWWATGINPQRDGHGTLWLYRRGPSTIACEIDSSDTVTASLRERPLREQPRRI